jgi:hypothetical protein
MGKNKKKNKNKNKKHVNTNQNKNVGVTNMATYPSISTLNKTVYQYEGVKNKTDFESYRPKHEC